jgi:hypothetical protein
METINLRNTHETYVALTPFTTIEQLNANTTAIRFQYGRLLTKSTREVLDVLHRYASKYFGVCYLSKSKIARMLGVHRSTVIRACNVLERLGIIAQHETMRSDGDRRQSTNAIVFIHQLEAKPAFIGDATPKCDTVNTPLNASNIKYTNDTVNTNINEKEASKKLIKQGLVTKLPETLQYALAPFFNADDIYTMAGTIYKAKASVDRFIAIEHYEEDYYNAILSVINAHKRGKARNLQGLLYHAIKSTTRSIWLRERTAEAYSA